MAENEEAQKQERVKDTKERVKVDNPAKALEDSCNKLVKFGGFDFLESVVDGVQNLRQNSRSQA